MIESDYEFEDDELQTSKSETYLSKGFLNSPKISNQPIL